MSLSEKGNFLPQKIKLLTQDEKGSHALVAINKKSTSNQKGTSNHVRDHVRVETPKESIDLQI